MTTVKVKFRPSSVPDRAGVLFLQLIHKREVRLLTTKINIFQHEWDATEKKLIIDTLDMERAVYLYLSQKELNEELEKLHDLIAKFRKTAPYSLSDLLGVFYDRFSKVRFDAFMKERINQLEGFGQKRTAQTYRTTLRVFLTFCQVDTIAFEQIDEILISEFEQSLLHKGLVKNTTSFYMRILRAVYRCAVNENLTQDRHPFRKVYTGVAKTEKRAVEARVIKDLKSLVDLNQSLVLSRDLFLFSFYTRGMSFVDIFYLKKENILNGVLVYKRVKTGQCLRIKMEACMWEIVEQYGFKNGDSQYLFPLADRLSSKSLYVQYTNALKLQNKRLKLLSCILKLETPLTSYVARHTWASIAKKKGVAISVISESMGHTSEATTQIYLANFDRKVIDKANLSVISI